MKHKSNITIPLNKYIEEALYNNEYGYYMKKNPFGKNGDYITSPNISVIFSEMIAIWIIAFWENLNCPKNFNLIELGAGNGEMMKQIIKTFDKFPLFKSCCKINILEKSVYLKKIQKKKLKNENVRWLKNLNEVSNIPNIFISNEFFDALPIKQFIKKKNQWYERNVKLSKLNCKKFIDIKFDIKKIEKEIGFNISSKQNFIEYSPLTMKYLKIISRKITSSTGGILIIDYGYWDNKMKNTLQSISNHDFNDVLKNFGKADITYNLNFRLIEKMLKKLNLKIIGKESQKNFLINLGILKRAEIISKNLAFSKKVNIYSRIKRLTDKNLMGDLFKVISATKKGINFYTGFTS